MLLVNHPIPVIILPALYGFSHISGHSINMIMKLRLSLLLYFLLGIGMFSHAQDKLKTPPKPPKVENGPDAIPVVVKSHKKGQKLPTPPPPKVAAMDNPGAPKSLKHLASPPPLAHPRKVKAEKPPKPDAPPSPDDKTY